MIQLDTFMIAEAARASEGRLYIHGGGITRIEAPLIPWTHPQLVIAVRFQMIDEAPGDEHTFAFSITGPAGEVVLPRSPFAGTVPDLQTVDGEERYFNFALTISPITFFREGVHVVEVEADEEYVGGIHLPVVRVHS